MCSPAGHAGRAVPVLALVAAVVDARRGRRDADDHVARRVEDDRLDAAHVELARADAVADRLPPVTRGRAREQPGRGGRVEQAVERAQLDLVDALRSRVVEAAVLLRPAREGPGLAGEHAAGVARAEQGRAEEVQRADGVVRAVGDPAHPGVRRRGRHRRDRHREERGDGREGELQGSSRHVLSTGSPTRALRSAPVSGRRSPGCDGCRPGCGRWRPPPPIRRAGCGASSAGAWRS